MIDLFKNLTLVKTRDIHIGRNESNDKPHSTGTDPDGLWSYVTQGLNVDSRRENDLAKRWFDLGYRQLTATCNNLKDEYESASTSYSEAVQGLTSENIRQ